MKHSVLVFTFAAENDQHGHKDTGIHQLRDSDYLNRQFPPVENHALRLLGTTPITAHPAPAASETNGRKTW
ncbi:hypothetical protein PO124_13295 [Bacillus licheniformis]|nr:hypothetical protein [Bacillus licheniformis]